MSPMQVKVVLNTPFDMIRSGPSSIVNTVKRNLPFAPYLQDLADKAISNIEFKTGSRSFNGVHLRVEADAQRMHEGIGGDVAVRAMYEEGLQLMGVNNTQPLYVASGFLSNVPEDGDKEDEILGNPWYQFCEEVRFGPFYFFFGHTVHLQKHSNHALHLFNPIEPLCNGTIMLSVT